MAELASLITVGVVILGTLCFLRLLNLRTRRRDRNDRPDGIQILSDPPNAKFEIVAVHGLGAHPEHTWTRGVHSQVADTTPRKVHLLRDLLPRTFPEARIIMFAYNSDWLTDAPIKTAQQIGERLRNQLKERKANLAGPRLPICFLGHSFGGIIIKQALYPLESTDPIAEDTSGIIFLGTPHQGSSLSVIGSSIARLTSLFGSSTGLLLSLEQHSSQLRDLADRFADFCERFKDVKIRSFCETKPSYVFGISVVSQDSAKGPASKVTPVDTDHSGLNKCYGPLDPVYKVIERSIVEMRCLSLLDQADAWIRQSYSSEKLKIERLSGAKLPMTQCYINLALEHQHSRNEQSGKAVKPPSFRPSFLERSKLWDPEGSDDQFDLDTFFNPHKIYLKTPSFRPSLLERFKILDPEESDDQFDLETLFNPRKIHEGEEARSPKRVMIRGRPGVGKTTLCKKIVHDFHHLQRWNDRFKRLLWIPLRKLSQSRGHYTLKDLLRQEYFGQHSSPNLILEEIYRQCDKNDDTETLFLLDGLDEIWPDRFHSDLDEFIHHLLNRPNVIVTSRPSVQFFSGINSFDLELETVGFHPAQVQQYVKNMEPQNASKILTFLHAQPLIAGLVRIPIQLDALCFAWKDKSAVQLADSHQPETMTDLYQAIEKGIWKKDAVALERIKQQTTPLWAELEHKVEKEIMLLEKLAFTGMYNHLTVFDAGTITQLSDHMPSPELFIDSTLRRLSLLRSSDVSPIDESREYYFLHLTLQEYFAARYIKREWVKGDGGKLHILDLKSGKCVALHPATFLHRHKYEEHFDVVWRFLSGLLNSNTDSQVSLFKTIQSQPLDMLGPAHQRLVIRCLFETTVEFPLRGRLEHQISDWLDFEYTLAEKYPMGNFKNRSLVGEMEFPIQVIYQKLSENVEVGSYLLQTINLRRTYVSAIVDLAAVYLRNHSDKHKVLGVLSFLNRNTSDKSTETSLLPEPVVQEVVERLGHMDTIIRRTAIEILQKQTSLPPSMVQAVHRRCDDEDSEVRRAVFHVLQQNKHGLPEGVFPVLVSKQLNDEDSHIRRAAFEILKNQNSVPGATLHEAVEGLRDTDSDVRKAAIQTFRDQPNIPETILQIIASKIDDEDTEFRLAAVQILSGQPILPETVLQTITQKLSRECYHIEYGAIKILRSRQSLPNELIRTSVEGLGNNNSEVRRIAVIILKTQPSLADPVIQFIVEKAHDEDYEVRKAALMVLQSQRSLPDAVVQAVIQNHEHKDPGVRLAAVGVLANQSSLTGQVIVTLIKMLEDPDSGVRSTVIKVIRNQQDQSEPIFQAIVQRLEDRDPGVQSDAIEALSKHPRLSETVLQVFAERLSCGSSSVSIAVSAALQKQPHLSDTLLLAVVQGLLNEEKSVRRRAGWLLAEQSSFPEVVLQAIIQIVEDEDKTPAVRWAAFKVFENQPSLPEAVLKASVQMLEDQDFDYEEEDWNYLKHVSKALKTLSNLSTPLLHVFVQMLEGDEWSSTVQKDAIECLLNQESLPEAILCDVMDMMLDGDEESTRWAAFEVVEGQPIRSDRVLGAIARRIEYDSSQLSDAAADLLMSQPNLSSAVLDVIAELLEDKEPLTQSFAARVLESQQSLPEAILQTLVQMLDASDDDATFAAMQALGKQRQLPKAVLKAIAGKLKSEDSELYYSALYVLNKQSKLPKAVLQVVATNLRRLCISYIDQEMLWMLRDNPGLFLMSYSNGSFEALLEYLLRQSFDVHFAWYYSDQRHCFIIGDVVVKYVSLFPVRIIDEAREACSIPVVAIDL